MFNAPKQWATSSNRFKTITDSLSAHIGPYALFQMSTNGTSPRCLLQSDDPRNIALEYLQRCLTIDPIRDTLEVRANGQRVQLDI